MCINGISRNTKYLLGDSVCLNEVFTCRWSIHMSMSECLNVSRQYLPDIECLHGAFFSDKTSRLCAPDNAKHEALIALQPWTYLPLD